MRFNTIDTAAGKHEATRRQFFGTEVCKMPRQLSAMQFAHRGDVIRQYAKGMGLSGGPSDVFDGQSRKAPTELAEILGFTEPAIIDRAIADAKQQIRDGRLTPKAAIENLMTVHARNASGSQARRLAKAFERCLSSDRPLAAMYAEMADEEPMPDASEITPIATGQYARLTPAEVERLRRDEQAIRFSRTHHTAMPEQLRDLPSEINAVQRRADRLRKGGSFADARDAYNEALRQYRAGC